MLNNTNKKLILIALGAFALWHFFIASKTFSVGDLEFTYVEKTYAGSGAMPLLIVLHGAGADEKDLLPIFDNLGKPLRVISIRGPVKAYGGYTWAKGYGESQKAMQADYDSNFAKVGAAVATASGEFSTKFSTIGKPMILGFSMGARLGAFLSLHYPQVYSKAFLVAGSLDKKFFPQQKLSTDIAVTFYHGKADGVISYAQGKQTFTDFKALHDNVEFVEHPGGHSLPDEVLRDFYTRL